MPVYSTTAGMVIYVGSSDSQGTYVIIESGLGIRFCYSRLSSADVSVGRYVAVGDVIGKTGQLRNEAEGFSLTVSYYKTAIDYSSIKKRSQEAS